MAAKRRDTPASWREQKKQVMRTGRNPLKAQEVLDAVKRYVSESGDNERQTASKLGISRVTLYRWLADKVQPHKRRLAQVAGLLRRIGYI